MGVNWACPLTALILRTRRPLPPSAASPMAISGCYTDCLCRLSGSCLLTNCMSSQRMWSRQPAAHSLLAPPSVEDCAPLIVEDHSQYWGCGVHKPLAKFEAMAMPLCTEIG